MIWIILGLTFVFVAGGIFSLLPSKAELRMAKIRRLALEKGMHVKLPLSLALPEGVKKGRAPFYCRKLSDSRFQSAVYYALRQEQGVQSSDGNIAVSLKVELDALLVAANPEIEAFYLGEGMVGFSWSESDDASHFNHLCDCIDGAMAIIEKA